MKIEGLTVPAAPNCPIAGEKLPLIVISHGYGGWYLGHHDTSEALADAGFIVVAINHPQANHADMSRANGLGVLIERPLDIKRTIDFMLTASPDAAKIDPQRVGFYGFSQGGYTGLVVAGGGRHLDQQAHSGTVHLVAQLDDAPDLIVGISMMT
jgi:predicted dienelactone hydrolase